STAKAIAASKAAPKTSTPVHKKEAVAKSARKLHRPPKISIESDDSGGDADEPGSNKHSDNELKSDTKDDKQNQEEEDDMEVDEDHGGDLNANQITDEAVHWGDALPDGSNIVQPQVLLIARQKPMLVSSDKEGEEIPIQARKPSKDIAQKVIGLSHHEKKLQQEMPVFTARDVKEEPATESVTFSMPWKAQTKIILHAKSSSSDSFQLRIKDQGKEIQ
ncbi:hypothetical protein DXG03_009217, partial [Asterophora parasitica]